MHLKGLKFKTEDDKFSLTIRYRFQARFGFSELENGDDWKFTGVEARIRRSNKRFIIIIGAFND